MFREYIKPLLVVTIICVVASAALAAVNGMTEPIIREAAEARANEMMKELIPEAAGFERIDISANDKVPDTVTQIFETSNNAGYVFIAEVSGFSGIINVICAIDSDGKIIKASTLSHTETQGIGTILDQESFLTPFTGSDYRLDGIDTVTGATISTSAYIGAIGDIFTAFDAIYN
ncbi:MAG: FMN-binding protein [Oscillospiraceae bacterium]|nr:FMN-binding protein [Oscillospiraceae bacterium]